ncbi:MAG: signal peptidase II [Deltaproteobacteria bacterium]|nr:signal peptidase II [Candidatus Zymogenaceae bacterium]
MKSPWAKYLLFGLVNLFVVAADQWSKLVVERHLFLNEFITIVPNFFDIRYIRNTGAAFGIMSRLPDGARLPFLIGVSLIAMGLIFFLFVKAEKERLVYLLSLSLVFAGAVGNLVDRVMFGEVRDFLHLHIYSLSWPIFNVADSAITVGIVLLAWELLIVEPRLDKAREAKKA